MAENIITSDDIKKLKDSHNKFEELITKYPNADFYDSAYYTRAVSSAYKETLNYFKKNDPGYLNEIIKNNGGKTDGLEAYHDFRRHLDGATDEKIDHYRKEWSKTDNAKKSRKIDTAYKQYVKDCENVTRAIIGEYGDQQVSGLYSPTYIEEMSRAINWEKIIRK